MKTRIVLYAFLLALLIVGQYDLFAQIKLAHINSQELLSSMPETDSAQKKLERIAQQHEMALEEMQVEFNKKFEEYNKNVETYSDLVRATKESELQDLQVRMQSFQQTAEQDLAQKRMELFRPIQEKAINAVNKVGEENGFTYIFDTGAGAVVYSAENTIDILPLVMEKLGLK
jgi:outer membrane protein